MKIRGCTPDSISINALAGLPASYHGAHTSFALLKIALSTS